MRASRVCPARGCVNLINGSAKLCAHHLRQVRCAESALRRAIGNHAEYGPAWRAKSRRILAAHGVSGRTHVVHHIVPRANGGTDDDDNLIVMSRKEHSALEARLRGRGVKIST